MSDVIKLLPDHIANQIAAGEVIQRPASVVKEMMENAIDAGADQIQVIIKDAGKTLIRIIDNGMGMSPQDAIMCFERHATSKVSSADDLFALRTKGFRGEALASVAAISHVTLKTKQKDVEVGTCIEMEGSKIKRNEACVCPTGTSFEVKNLFYNVPARRNFLKSDNVEFNHILDEFERVALAHPELSFSLDHNDARIFNLQSGVLRKRIVDILGKNTNDRLVPIEESTDIVKVTGYVGKPEFAKKTRGEQFFFVNHRFFKDSYFNHALTKAFDGLIQQKHFPSYFLYLQVDPQRIDVNVHPTKTEIKFEEDKLIYSILLSSIRQALGKYNVMPTLDFEQETSFDIPHEMKFQPVVEPTIKVNPNYNPFNTSSRQSSSGNYSGNTFTSAIKAEGFGIKDSSPADWENFYKIEESDSEPQPSSAEISFEEDLTKTSDFLFRGKYLFTTTKSGLLVIDTQRAYERIVYDDLFNQFISRPIDSQQLLFPIEKELSQKEQSCWQENQTILQRLGFQWSFSEQFLLLTAIPSVLEDETIHECVDLIIEEITFKEIDKGEIAHIIVKSIAAAAGSRKNSVTKDTADQFIEQLFQCAEHAYSPRGKKILQTISQEEIAAKF